MNNKEAVYLKTINSSIAKQLIDIYEQTYKQLKKPSNNLHGLKLFYSDLRNETVTNTAFDSKILATLVVSELGELLLRFFLASASLGRELIASDASTYSS